MAKAAETTPAQLPDAETVRRLFRTMALVRRFEERTEEQYTRARIGGCWHPARREGGGRGRGGRGGGAAPPGGGGGGVGGGPHRGEGGGRLPVRQLPRPLSGD